MNAYRVFQILLFLCLMALPNAPPAQATADREPRPVPADVAAPIGVGVRASRPTLINTASRATAPESLAAESPVTGPNGPEAILWNNGPLVTHPGRGYNGADVSAVQTALHMDVYGFGHQLSGGRHLSDQFTITASSGWNIETITFFAFQTGSYSYPPSSSITGIYLQIWNGPPWESGSAVVWGDLTTNRLVSTAWSGIYRVLDVAITNNQRPIMASVAAVPLSLPPGTYWLDWMSDGSLASGPWAPPITILNQTTTGDAYQYTTVWAPALDTGTQAPQGMPFIIRGTGLRNLYLPLVLRHP